MSIQTALTMDELRARVPSAFAVEPYQKLSTRYAFLSTEAAITAMIDNGFQPYDAMESRTGIPEKKGHTKHLIRFRQVSQLVMAGDSIPEFLLLNSSDGSSLWKLMAGIFKIACTNGLIVAESLIESISIRHSGNIADDVVEGTLKLVAEMPKAIDTIQRWKSLELSNPEQRLFAEAVHMMRFADAEGKLHTPIEPAQLLTPRRTTDAQPDLWSVFNRVQENATKGGIQALNPNGRRITTRRVKAIDADVKLNKAMWHLAEGLEKIKTA